MVMPPWHWLQTSTLSTSVTTPLLVTLYFISNVWPPDMEKARIGR